MTIQYLRGDARHLDLPDASVDLVITSPPYFGQRSYVDGGEHYTGQIGDEPTPGEYVDNIIDCMREWARVLKPDGNIWLNLGDKYTGGGGQWDKDERPDALRVGRGCVNTSGNTYGMKPKSLIGLPWRVALRCIDELGLILRAEVIWSKPSGMPESVTDRVRRNHEQWFHFVRQPRYYAAIDYVRTAHLQLGRRRADIIGGKSATNGVRHAGATVYTGPAGPVGALPPSVWEIASEPLRVPEHIAHAKCCDGIGQPGCNGLDHYAAFPLETVIRIIQGWSPSGVCTKCGEGRRPATFDERLVLQSRDGEKTSHVPGQIPAGGYRGSVSRVITGEICACTPHTQHAASGERHANQTVGLNIALQSGQRSGKPHTGPWREYHYDQWDPAPTTPAVVLDPFGGTGTVSLVAEVLGRDSIYNDMSADYLFLAQWRTTDPNEMARAMRVAKPPKPMDEQISLFDLLADEDEVSA